MASACASVGHASRAQELAWRGSNFRGRVQSLLSELASSDAGSCRWGAGERETARGYANLHYHSAQEQGCATMKKGAGHWAFNANACLAAAPAAGPCLPLNLPVSRHLEFSVPSAQSVPVAYCKPSCRPRVAFPRSRGVAHVQASLPGSPASLAPQPWRAAQLRPQLPKKACQSEAGSTAGPCH